MVRIFLDLKKAFDFVSQDLLLIKLFPMGLKGNIYNFPKNYLSDWYQFVNKNEFFSEKIKILFRVHQGSVLEPLLLNFFIDDISKINCNGIILYADDGAFCVVDNNFSLLMSRVKLIVNNVTEFQL